MSVSETDNDRFLMRLRDSTHNYSCGFRESPLRWVMVNSKEFNFKISLQPENLAVLSKKILYLRWSEIIEVLARTHLDSAAREFA